MEKRTVHLFCVIGIFGSLLYSDEVSSASPTSVLDVMKKDSNLCRTYSFFNESHFISNCAKWDYPKENVSLKYENVETFLCIGVYDAWYKICQYSSQWRNPFQSTAEFNSHIQKLFPGKTKDEKENFCKHIKNIRPMYAKTKSFVLSLMKSFNTNNMACPLVCFDLDDEFNPLCAILLWIQSVEENIKNSGSTLQTNMDTTDLDKKTINNPKEEIVPKTSDFNKPIKAETTANNIDAKQGNVNPAITNSKEQTTTEKKKANDPDKTENDSADAKEGKYLKSPDANPKDVAVAPSDNSRDEKIQKDENIQHAQTSVKTRPSDTENVRDPVVPDTAEHVQSNQKLPNDEVKTSTISQNTQNHDNTANQDDYSHVIEEAVAFDPDDVPDQTADNDDQSQNILEPSEQRETIPRYHSIRTEEASHILTYLIIISLGCIAGYIGYHNKQKILAIVLEGRRTRNNRGKRRPSTASYRKLDCTLEEAVTSQCNANVTHVIY